MPAPTATRWMATRSRNAFAHPGVVDISIEEETVDNLPKTPAQKRKPRGKKDTKSAEEVEAGIQRVAAYERQSLNEELVDATPQVVYTPAPPRDLSDPHELSEHDEGGNISDDTSCKLPSESVGDVLVSGAGVGSLRSPVGKMVDEGEKGKKGGRKGKDTIVRALEDSTTEPDDEPTPFKRVMSEKGKIFGKAVDSTPIKAMAKGVRNLMMPAVAEDSATESDEPVVPRNTGKPKVAPSMSKQFLKASATAGPAAGSNDESRQPNSAPSRPRPKPFKQPEAPAAPSAPKKAASKPVTKPGPSTEMLEKPEPKSLKSKAKPARAKSELAMAKDALKKAQEEMKKAQEVQKKAREEAKRLKESTREPGVRDRIKAANNGKSVEDRSPQPPGFNRLSNSSKSSTHRNGDIASSKSKPKSNARGGENPYEGIFDFGSDNATSQPNPKPQSPPRNDLFDFGSYDDGPHLNLEDNKMEIDLVEPSAKAAVSSKPKTTKKAVASGSWLAKSGNTSGGMSMKASEKGRTEMSTNTGKKRSSATGEISNNDESGPPSKKRKAERDPIATWIDHVKPNAPPPSRAASSSSKNTLRTVTSSRRLPSLTVGSTRSSNSTLTNTIRITQNPQLPTTAVKKEPKKARIEVEDNGVFSDCDETEGQERERALASGVKHGVRATSSNMVTEDLLKSVAPPPKASRPFKKAGLPEGLNYELLRRTVIPTIIAYLGRQRNPWDRPASILCSEIRTIIRHTGRVDFEVDPKGAIYKNVNQRLIDSWRSVIGSVSVTIITTFIFENQEKMFPTQKKVTAWANEQLTDWRFLYVTTEGDDTKQWRGLLRNGAILGTFAAHLVAIQGAKQIPDLEVDGAKPAFAQAYGALALCAAGVQHALLLYGTETITLEMIRSTGKAPSRLPRTLNQSTGKYSTRATGFNDASCGELTQRLLKLIIHALRPESYDKIVAGAKAIAVKTRRAVHTDDVIDLTADEPPAEFAMVVDNPSDDEDRNGNENGELEIEGDDSIKIEGDDNIKIEGEEDIEFKNEEGEEQSAIEDEDEEENNSVVYEDDEDEDDYGCPSFTL